MNKTPLHILVAEKLIEELKRGTAPWQRPWDERGMLPFNPVTGKRYRGGNALHLMLHPYKDARWMTYKQALSTNAQVRKGEKGTVIQYWKFTEEKNVEDAQGNVSKITFKLEKPRMFCATVFNAEQIDGLPAHVHQYQQYKWDPVERVEEILQASGAHIVHGENKAFYHPRKDSIHLPDKTAFPDQTQYYATALHELAHWTGHETRLNRDLKHPFGSEGYAREELRAEIASLILGETAGIGHNDAQHVAYVSSWIKILQDDPMEIFRASADAEKIHDYIQGLTQTQHIELKTDQEQSMEMQENHPEQPKNITIQRPKPEEKQERIWLDIPYSQKDLAKEIAGFLPDGKRAISFDREKKRWYAEAEANIEKLSPWIPSMPEKGKSAMEKTWLFIPYEHLDAVKQIAGKLPDDSNALGWDKEKKCWYANIGANLDVLKPWVSNHFVNESSLPVQTPLEEFRDVLAKAGCLLTENHPIMDGKPHRIALDSDKKGEKSGFYVGFLDGHPAGYVKNNRSGEEIKWRSRQNIIQSMDQAVIKAQLLQKQVERLKAHQQLQDENALQIQNTLQTLQPILKNTPYLEKKGIQPKSGIFTDSLNEKTYIPMIDCDGKVWSMQTISANGAKYFAKNCRKEGCFHVIGGLETIKNTRAILVAEGYATAATLAEALNMPVVVAFDAGNLVLVASGLKERFPEKPLVIAADDDKKLELTKKGNPGKKFAINAAEKTGGSVIFPVFAPGEQEQLMLTDFNDLAMKSILGMDGVRRQMQHVLHEISSEHDIAIKHGNTSRRQLQVM